jgi:hypothetical protein
VPSNAIDGRLERRVVSTLVVFDRQRGHAVGTLRVGSLIAFPEPVPAGTLGADRQIIFRIEKLHLRRYRCLVPAVRRFDENHDRAVAFLSARPDVFRISNCDMEQSSVDTTRLKLRDLHHRDNPQ